MVMLYEMSDYVNWIIIRSLRIYEWQCVGFSSLQLYCCYYWVFVWMGIHLIPA